MNASSASRRPCADARARRRAEPADDQPSVIKPTYKAGGLRIEDAGDDMDLRAWPPRTRIDRAATPVISRALHSPVKTRGKVPLRCRGRGFVRRRGFAP